MAAWVSSKAINFSKTGFNPPKSFFSTKEATASGEPKGTWRMERSSKGVTGIWEGSRSEERGQGEHRERSNQIHSHLEGLG